jgi:putative transferase (TIGR04331 family)
VVHLGKWCTEGLENVNNDCTYLSEEEVSVLQKVNASTDVQNVVERVFPDLVDGLNAYHNKTHSSRYWRIILGRWLYGFVDVVYQRLNLIERALNEFEISVSDGICADPKDLVADCTQDYLRQLVSQPWNSALFCEILKACEVPCEEISSTESWKPRDFVNREVRQRSVFSSLYGMFSARSRIAIADPYVSRLSQMLLAISTRSLPLRVERAHLRSGTFDSSGRKLLVNQIETRDRLENLVRVLLPKHLPRSVVELFISLTSQESWIGYPKEPRGIFTANAHHSSDHFTIWIAEKVEAGAPLALSQHGGLYGESLIRSRHEEHEVSVADRYLTWGWDDGKHDNLYPIPSLIGMGVRPRARREHKQRNVVVVTDATARFSRYAWDTSRDRTEYISRVRSIVQNLTRTLPDPVVLRLHHAHEDFDISNVRHYGELGKIRIDNGEEPMSEILATTRLLITTTLGTTFGESVARDIPTIICVDPVVYPEREEFRNYFAHLRSVGAYFNDPSKMCTFIESIWPNVYEWWESESVQSAVDQFRSNFFRRSDHPIRELTAVLRSMKP